MKRFCYLLTFFLTGFSIASNESSLSGNLLLTDAGTGALYKVELLPLPLCSEPGHPNADQRPGKTPLPNQPVAAFICLLTPAP